MPELRKDPVTNRWVIIATERARRPSDFVREPVVLTGVRFCPFCPGSEHKTPPEILVYRNGGADWTLRIVPNKFPALRVEGDLSRQGEGLYDKSNGVGAHEVIIETPCHNQSMADLEEKRIEDIFWAFRERILDLRKDRRLRYILIFKNHGEAAGATLEHSHWQLIALPIVPRAVQDEIDGSRRYFDYKERCVYCDIIRQEESANVRVILETERFVAVAPFAPRFPFETWILPRTHRSHFEMCDAAEYQNLAWVLRTLLRKTDRVLEKPAFNCVLHNAPLQESSSEHYHWHIELIPKLTKVAGFEVGSGFYINPTPPEESAKFLREAPLA